MGVTTMKRKFISYIETSKYNIGISETYLYFYDKNENEIIEMETKVNYFLLFYVYEKNQIMLLNEIIHLTEN